jgi:short-subunit dehydrogenase
MTSVINLELPLNKVCVVVGVGEGLGAALARRFAAGYKVALLARSAEVIEAVAGEIKSAGGVALAIQSDAPSRRRSRPRMSGSRARLGRSKF